MAKNYGNTWWGMQWLKSLDHIDYANRIPRGATYARKGNVEKVTIKKNVITAHVAGSRKAPYRVKIEIPLFNSNDIDRLMSEIEKRPALISRLLNRDLDQEMMRIAKDLGLLLFPRKWDDLEMKCSCPDWAVPCKHLAAVIYILSREIDNNPFLVFEMHGVNLVNELRARNIYVENNIHSNVIRFEDLLVKQTKVKPGEYCEEDAYNKLDFTTIKPLSSSLVKLLSEDTPFDQVGNFRDKYEKNIERMVRKVNRALTGPSSVDTLYSSIFLKPFGPRTRFALVLKHDLTWTLQHVYIGEVDPNHIEYSNDELLKALAALAPEDVENFQPSVAALHNALFFAIHLLANGAVIPQLVKLPNNKFIVRWLPALMDPHIQFLLQQLADSLPPRLLTVVPAGHKLSVELKNQAEWLVSLFLNDLIIRLSTDVQDHEMLSFFFLQKPISFSGIGESSVVGAIKIWLDRYYIASREFSPVLLILEKPNNNFALSISIAFKDQSGAVPVPVSEIITLPQYDDSRYRILRELTLLSRFIPGLDLYINSHCKHDIGFNSVEFAPFLMDVIPAIKLLNIKVMMPRSLGQLLRPKPTIRLNRTDNPGSGFLSLSKLLTFDWQVALGDHLIDQESFLKLTNKAMGLIKFKGQYIYMDEAETKRIFQVLTSDKSLSGIEMLQAALSEDYEGAPVALSDDVRKLIQEITTNTDVPLPEFLHATLRPYQLRGYSWLYRNTQIGFGSILADDMGLGKTIQVLAFLLKLKEEGVLSEKKRAMIVVPTGLLYNWQVEIQRFTPLLRFFIYHGSSRNLSDFDADLLITSYGVMRSDHELLKKKKWCAVIIDEAQNIKNAETARSKAIRNIRADIKVAMSGTPVENRLSEFWSIMDFVNKGYLGSAKHFRESFANPIQVYHDEQCVDRFRKITAPFMMRRLKSDKSIISDLPDKIEQNEYAHMTASQTALYHQTLEEAMKQIEGIVEVDNQSLFKRQGLVLQMILALKQICNHPSQFLKHDTADPLLSGKSLLLLDLIKMILERNEKVLIFTQFKEMGKILMKMLEEQFGENPMFYHGGSSLKQRKEMVDRFQNNRADRIFILSLKAAGTGLNLTAASHVIHYDLWWNPAVEAQATDRAYRIGQSKNVFVHRCITTNTFEERIDAMIQQKKDLADMTISTGESWIGKLNNGELRDIFG